MGKSCISIKISEALGYQSKDPFLISFYISSLEKKKPILKGQKKQSTFGSRFLPNNNQRREIWQIKEEWLIQNI